MTPSLSDALGVLATDTVALVGGGGKTTALRILGADRAAAGAPALLSTTTRIEPQPDLRTVFVSGPGDLASLAGPWPALAITEDLGHRRRGVPPGWIDAAARAGRPAIVQADGSARRPFKAPGEGEPVIPRAATLVVCVVGLDALGAVLGPGRVHRPERVAALTGLSPGERIGPEHVAAVLAHADGGGRGVPAGARRAVLLNKADDAARMQGAAEVAARLSGLGLRVVAASLRASPPSVRRLI